MSLHPRLERLFRTLTDQDVRWTLLRPPAALAERDGDIDLLVRPEDLGRVRRIATAQGFVPVPSPEDLHAADYDAAADRFLWLHVQTELRAGGAVAPAAAVLDVVVSDPLPRLRDDWLLWTLLLHGLLDKGAIAERHRPVIMRLARSGAASAGGCSLAAQAGERGLSAELVLPLAAAGDWRELERLAATTVTGGRRAPRPRVRPGGALRRARRLWNRRGIGVAVIGPDGAGKTTLVSALRDALPFPARVQYMGLTGGRLPRADALRVPGLVLAARLAILWARYGIGLAHRLRGEIVLFDRYVLDGRVPSGASPGPLARASRRLQAAACPRPDLIVLLDASGTTMHRRKGEYDSIVLESWRAAYRRLGGSRRVAMLDAERPADAVLRDAKALIWRCYARRWSPQGP